MSEAEAREEATHVMIANGKERVVFKVQVHALHAVPLRHAPLFLRYDGELDKRAASCFANDLLEIGRELVAIKDDDRIVMTTVEEALEIGNGFGQLHEINVSSHDNNTGVNFG